jgi:MoaA/NifB/PqqE/SkfB family radical SAM enzyme/ubiquinone/menaquinone biosynthesis C-methylase UbiE
MDHHTLLSKAQKLINRIVQSSDANEYKGRQHHRKLKQLKECWFHITNRCNMACKHCLFCSNPQQSATLPYNDLINSIDEVYDAGCRIFYFTGGEPFVYPGFIDACNHILNKQGTHIVILTNGKNIAAFHNQLLEIPKDRMHFQLSIDGMKENHEAVRGDNSFAQLITSLQFIKKLGFPVSLAMVVNKLNAGEMASLVDFASAHQVKNIHYLWLFKKGHAEQAMFADPDHIYENLLKADQKANQKGITIDNMEIFKSQIYSLPGTKFDMNNAGWESLAIGPEGNIYPSPALIGEKELVAGHINQGIRNVWTTAPVLKQLRNASVKNNESLKDDLLKYLTGGGDIDHSYIAGRKLVGCDPYYNLYKAITLYLLTNSGLDNEFHTNENLSILKRMGEKLHDCSEDDASVSFTHSNCVLSLPGKDGYSTVRSFYSNAARQVNDDITNPVPYQEDDIAHIPAESRVRSYGCGSPVMDCNLQEGETLVDLGSGTGTECFMAAKKTGKNGMVHGIDMADPMLDIAKQSAQKTTQNLGYNNVQFHKGFLEQLPLDNDLADVVISNCVINLSPDKRQTYKEIMRVLKPGGRICIADIVSTGNIPLDIRYNEKLRGECIGGAMTETELFGMLEDIGFEEIFVEKRFLYRQIKGYDFFSLTYIAYKPQVTTNKKTIIYRGPYESITLDNGLILHRGLAAEVPVTAGKSFSDAFFVLDKHGNPENVAQEASCSCFTAPEKQQSPEQNTTVIPHQEGCMACGADLIYHETNKAQTCHYCKKTANANAICSNGHYVCDDCHSKDAATFLKAFAKQAAYNDMIKMMEAIRNHPSMRIHGPEHHSMVPAIMVAVYKNQGGAVTDEDIDTAVERGQTIAGGSCAFMGVCGAASGVGTGFSILLKSTPYKGKERQMVQQIAKDVLTEIASYEAARCCQRDCYTALKIASEKANTILNKPLPADIKMICTQYKSNKECIGNKCPLWHTNVK